MYAWARDILQNSGAGHLIDLQAVHRMLDAHREGPVDHSRRIWAVLVFLLWHGIFVEKRIVPEVPDPDLPGQDLSGPA
jgi:asparagine synthase (glutamine-hydrolysing)